MHVHTTHHFGIYERSQKLNVGDIILRSCQILTHGSMPTTPGAAAGIRTSQGPLYHHTRPLISPHKAPYTTTQGPLYHHTRPPIPPHKHYRQETQNHKKCCRLRDDVTAFFSQARQQIKKYQNKKNLKIARSPIATTLRDQRLFSLVFLGMTTASVNQ